MSHHDRADLDTRTLALAAMRCRGGAPALGADELGAHVTHLPGWRIAGASIAKTYTFADFHETMAFVNALAFVAHREDHHPNLGVRYRECDVTYTTHDAGGVTLNDVICAAKIERLFT